MQMKIFVFSLFQSNAENDDGFTALHAATDVGSTKTVEALLEAGARTDAINTYRETCFHTAARRNRAHITETLLLHGCPVDKRNLAGQTEVTKPRSKSRKNQADIQQI